MPRFRLFRLSRLFRCGPDDGDSRGKHSTSPPPEYRSVEGNLRLELNDGNGGKLGNNISRARRIGFVMPSQTNARSDTGEEASGDGTKGKGRTDHGEENDMSRGGRWQGVPENTFLMPSGEEVTLNTNDDFVQATLAAARTGDEVLDDWLALGYGIEIRDTKDWSALKWAVHLNQVAAAHRLIQRGAEVNQIIHGGFTELHRAASQGNEELILILLKYGADINTKDDQGNTPLHCALNHWLKTDTPENLSIVKLLAEKGADLQALNNYGNTLLHEACMYGDGLPLRYLPGYTTTPSSPAITHKRLAMARTLLDLGIPVDTRDKWGSTPLLRCCTMQAPDRDVIEFLLERGADVHTRNNHGDTALDAVCFQRDTELLKQVAARAIDSMTTTTTTTGLFNKPTILSTPLHYAAEHSGPDRVAFLLAHGANPQTPTYATGATPLHLLASAKSVTSSSAPTATDHRPTSPSPSIATTNTNVTITAATNPNDPLTAKISLLTSHGADINARDLTGATPLHYAARNIDARHQERLVVALLNAGAEVDARDARGKTPLKELEGYWVRKGAVVKRLLEAGAAVVEGMEGVGRFGYMDRGREDAS
ncbi:hypothetical protein AJ79_00428 [Helicocarpus griseus UAMH5409]|uniref:Uncharacterized protein n=1 Tax=Helicocarpus griseus UAMH5409 TaxID=1447875 RepID=A0A2B7YBX2_9EURO|nr:hypothetical protein AJ79_00428 [Helicocarpus griseus UAMH5409]